MTRTLMAAAAMVFPILSCARQEAPPGGPPDNIPPIVASTQPEAFAVDPEFRGPVVLRFSERISEQPAEGAQADAVLVSPATSPVEVEFQRSSIRIDLENGFEPGRVYRIRVSPVVNDMFDNPMLEPFELVFSTGPDFGDAVVGGIVRDRITGEPLSGARIHATAADDPDGPRLVSRTDGDGIFTFRYLTAGSYGLRAFDDLNRNRESDPSEPFALQDVTLAGGADTLVVSMDVLPSDTTPPIVVDVEVADSTTLRILTDDYLDPTDPPETARSEISVEGGDPAPQIFRFIHWPEWEEMAAAADSAAAGGAGGAGGDPGAAEPPGGPEDDAGPPLPRRELYGLLVSPLEPGVEYAITVSGLVNIAGTGEGGGEATFVWEPPPADTLDAAADSAAAAPDSAAAAPDSVAAPGDAPDTGGGANPGNRR